MAPATADSPRPDVLFGMPLPACAHECPYLAGRTACLEEFLVGSIGDEAFSCLVERGYRHFGRHFFRPRCEGCGACIPLRVRVDLFPRSRSSRRLFRRNADLCVDLRRPVASVAAYRLYRLHKERFPSASPPESYRSFATSLFEPLPFSYVLEIRDGARLVCVSHLDITDRVLSAVYCYYDTGELRRSLGRYAICLEIELARRRGIPFVYLGFYIRDNPHMRYKGDYRPSQVLLDGTNWVDFATADGQGLPAAQSGELAFAPGPPLFAP